MESGGRGPSACSELAAGHGNGSSDSFPAGSQPASHRSRGVLIHAPAPLHQADPDSVKEWLTWAYAQFRGREEEDPRVLARGRVASTVEGFPEPRTGPGAPAKAENPKEIPTARDSPQQPP